MADTQIKIIAGVNEVEIRKATSLIQGLVSEVNKLVNATQRVGQSMGGGGLSMSNKAIVPGMGGAAGLAGSSQGVAGGATGGGLAGGLLSGVQNMSNLFKTAAEGSKGAFKTMQDSLKATVNAEIQEINRLKQALAGLDMSVTGSSGAPIHQGTHNALNSQISQREAGVAGMAGGGAAGGGGGGGWGSFKTVFGSQVPGTGGLNRLAGVAGLSFLGAGAIGAAVGGLAFINNAMGTQFKAETQYALDKPMWQNQAASRFADYNVHAEQVRHGGGSGLAAGRAYALAMREVAGRGLLSSYSLNKGMLDVNETGYRDNGAFSGDPSKRIANARARAGAAMSRGETDPFNLGAEFVSDLISPRERAGGQGLPGQLEQERRKFFRDPAAMERLDQIQQQKMKEGARYNAVLANAMDTSYSNVSMARDFGVDLDRNTNRMRNLGPGHFAVGMTGLEAMTIRAQNAGMSAAEYGAYRTQAGATLGPEFKGIGESYWSAIRGGLGNAMGLYGAGMQYGNGAGLVSAVQGGIGRGGVGIMAGSKVADIVSSYMTDGMYSGSNGASAMSGFLSATMSGSPASDTRMGRIMGSGLGQYQQYAGGADPLGKAMAVLGSVGGAPGDYVAQEALRQAAANPTLMAEILRTGKVPAAYQRAGLNLQSFRQMADFQSRNSLIQYMPGATGGGAAAVTARAFQSSGQTVSEFIKGRLKSGGLTAGSGAGRKLIREITGDLGTARLPEGGTLESNQGLFEVMASMDPELRGALKGKGAHAVGIRRTVEEAGAKADAKTTQQDADLKAQKEKELKGDIGRKKEYTDILDEIAMFGKQLGGKDGLTVKLEASMSSFIKALDSGTVALRAVAKKKG